MLSTALHRTPHCGVTSTRTISKHHQLMRALATSAPTTQSTPRQRAPRKEGDISSVFSSLSNLSPQELPPRFAALKTKLIANHEEALAASWTRLLSSLRDEISEISTAGSSIIPSIDYSAIKNGAPVDETFKTALHKRGAAIIRNVIPSELALKYKSDIRDYIKKNPHTKAFPPTNPAVFELYWAPGQVHARAHPNIISTQKFLMSFWHSLNPEAEISTNCAVTYADRLRIRNPGDSGFALGAHVDGGSVERWEPEGYGLGGVYDDVWKGNWEAHDPWESSCRLPVVSDLHDGAGACSMFRMFQGWLSMSSTGPGEGTLLVNPLFKLATTYLLLRPFFSPIHADTSSSSYLDAANWALDPVQSSVLQGATPSCTQELTAALHPHLELSKSMVHVPRVEPGDYAAWHCDSIHAVDSIHDGQGDSSVLYIPTCPLTAENATYLVRQREAFLEGTPGPDFPGGEGESRNVGRTTKQTVLEAGGEEAVRAMGMGLWETNDGRPGEKNLIGHVNAIVS